MAALVAVIAVCLLAVPVGTKAYDHPKDALLIVAGLPIIGLSFVQGFVFGIPLHFFSLLCAACLWWTVRAVQGHLLKTSIETLLLRLTLIALCIIAVGSGYALEALIIAGLVNTAVVMMQSFGVPVPHPSMVMKGSKYSRRFRPVGLQGNENFSGLFLVPCVFASLALSMYMIAIILAIGVALSRCKVAMCAVGCGLLFIVSPFIAIPALIVVVFNMINVPSFRYRLDYWRAAWETVRREWIFGVGLNSWKMYVAEDFRRAGLGGKERVKTLPDGKVVEAVLKPPRRSHNDYIQAVLETGVLGVFFTVMIFATAFLLSDGWMRAGVAALAVCGLGFHNLSLPSIAGAFWLFILSAVSGAGGVVAENPYVPFAMMLCAPLCMPFVARVIADCLLLKAHRAKDRQEAYALLRQAEAVNPDDENVQMALVIIEHGNDMPHEAFTRCNRLATNYTGEIILEYLFANLEHLWDRVVKRQNPYKAKTKMYKGC